MSDAPEPQKRGAEETEEAPAKKKGKSKHPDQHFESTDAHLIKPTTGMTETKSIAQR